MGGILKSVSNTVGSLLGAETPAVSTPAVQDPVVKPTPAAAITTAQPAVSTRTRPATGTRPRSRGARSTSILTTDLGDGKLGG